MKRFLSRIGSALLLAGVGSLALWAVLATVAPEVTGSAGRQLQAQRERDRLTFETLLGAVGHRPPRPGDAQVQPQATKIPVR